MRICVFGASSNSIDKKYVEAVERLGEKLAKRGHSLVFGRGAGGLMGAAARGFEKGGCKDIIGVSPIFFNVDGKLFQNCSISCQADTMRERKAILEKLADVFLVVPGGIGTMDEFFEIITLRSLGRLSKPVALYNLDGFYDPMMRMLQKYEKEGFLNLNGEQLFACIDNEEALIDYIENTKPEFLESKFFKNV